MNTLEEVATKIENAPGVKLRFIKPMADHWLVILEIPVNRPMGYTLARTKDGETLTVVTKSGALNTAQDMFHRLQSEPIQNEPATTAAIPAHA